LDSVERDVRLLSRFLFSCPLVAARVPESGGYTTSPRGPLSPVPNGAAAGEKHS
jgi:hypothetical protein